MIEPYSARQAKEISNTEQKFAQLREIEQKARSFKGTMTYRKTKGHNYLVRWFYDEERKENSARRTAKVMGRKSPEMDQLLDYFQKGRKAARMRAKNLRRDLDAQARINREVGIGRVPELSAKILRAFERSGIGANRMKVVGTHALYVYEMLAGVILHEDITGTEDIDLLLDAREELKFLIDDGPDDERLISVLRTADRSFERTNRPYRAVNRDGFLVDFIKPEGKVPWQDDVLVTKIEDMQPSPIQGLSWLVNAKSVQVTVIDQKGQPLRMSAPDPRAFAIHKLWLTTRPTRDPIKKGRDLLQAAILASMLYHHLPEQFPWKKSELRSIPSEIVDLGLQNFRNQFKREDAEMAKEDDVDLDAIIERLKHT